MAGVTVTKRGVSAATESVTAGQLPKSMVSRRAAASNSTLPTLIGPEASADSTGATDVVTLNNISAAVPAAGGIIDLVAGATYYVNAPLVFDAIKVLIRMNGATIKAVGALAQVVQFKRLVQNPGLGISGGTIDMSGAATIGVELRNCGSLDATVAIVNPGSGTGVHLVTDNSAFGCYYNRVRVVSSGATQQPSAVGTGVLIEGQNSGNQTNDNTIFSSHLTNFATGIKIGAFTQSNNLIETDCSLCNLAYDLGSGITHFDYLWEEQSATYGSSPSSTGGMVVRTGAIARGRSDYIEKYNVEGTGLLLLDKHDGTRQVMAGPTSGSIDEVFTAVGNGTLTRRFDPAALSWHFLGGLFRVDHAIYPATPANAEQTACAIYAGTGVPSNANGNNGDIYLRSDGGSGTVIYQKRAGAWVATAA